MNGYCCSAIAIQFTAVVDFLIILLWGRRRAGLAFITGASLGRLFPCHQRRNSNCSRILLDRFDWKRALLGLFLASNRHFLRPRAKSIIAGFQLVRWRAFGGVVGASTLQLCG
jgi:hypothetical protein